MKVKLTQFNVDKGRRFMAYSEAGARRWCQKNGHTVISVERIKDSVDSIREKYLGDVGNKENHKSVQLARIATPASRENTFSEEKYKRFKSASEDLVNDLNKAVMKHLVEFNGDKTMLEAIRRVRDSISTLDKFAKTRRKMLYSTELNVTR